MNTTCNSGSQSETSLSSETPEGRVLEGNGIATEHVAKLGCGVVDPSFECPRFHRCSVNRCPLSPWYPRLASHPDDPEKKCRATKATRVKVATRYPGLLHYGGLTGKEFAASKRELPEALKCNRGRGFPQNARNPERCRRDLEIRNAGDMKGGA